MPPAFLNSREDAILLWAAVLVGYAVYKDPRGIGSAFWSVIRAFFTPKLPLLFGSAALYSAGLVLLAVRLELWHMTALRETLYWFVGTVLILVGTATSAAPNETFLRLILRRALAFTIIIEFAVSLYVFPFLAEAILVPLVVLVFGMQAIARYDSKTNGLTLKVIDGVVLSIGLFLLSYFGVRAIFDLGGLLNRETAERFLVVPVFTLALIPFLYIVAWYSRREMERLRAAIQFSRLEAS